MAHLKQVYGLFPTARISKQKNRKPKTVRVFLNTAIKESDLPQSVVDALGLVVDNNRVSAYVTMHRNSRPVRGEFLVVPDRDEGSAYYNIGTDLMRKAKIVIDPAIGRPARRSGKQAQLDIGGQSQAPTSE